MDIFSQSMLTYTPVNLSGYKNTSEFSDIWEAIGQYPYLLQLRLSTPPTSYS